MQHDFSIVFDTDNELWQRVLDIFAKNEKYDKKIVKNRNLHHKFPRSFSKALGEEVDNDKDNLISLSLADHFLVHYYYYLLAKKGYRQSMSLAFRLMARKGMKYITPETAEAMAKDYEAAVEISKQYLSDTHTGENNPMYGKQGTMKGKTFTSETRKKMSEAHKGTNNGFYGKIHSEETRKKMSNALKEYWARRRQEGMRVKEN